jgi:hypothetical protein
MPPTTFWEDIRHFSFKYWVSFTLVCVCIHTQADACVLKTILMWKYYFRSFPVLGRRKNTIASEFFVIMT